MSKASEDGIRSYARGVGLGLVAPLFAAWATAETITWEAAAVGGPAGRQVLAQGVKTYSPAKDIIVKERPARHGGMAWTKSLLLDDTFALSASVYQERALTGFGLMIYRRGDRNGFSWEWFDRDREDVFEKRQESGRLRVGIKKSPGYEEIESVEFLDDVVLRYLDDMSKPPGTHTHEMIVRKGSILRVAP